MQGEHDHPLRDDPLQSLPDAVTVPRRPRPKHPVSPPPPKSPQPIPPRIPTPIDPQSFNDVAHSLLDSSSNSDPLLQAIAADLPKPPSPPGGNAFATDVRASLAAIDENPPDHPAAAGLVDRSDVSIQPAPAVRGSAAGVYLVRSRRNWAASSPQSDEYYTVRRSIADFYWLEERLRARYDAVIVPSLPQMSILGRITHGYAYDYERLRRLEAFLRRVATHAVLSTGDEVLSFLGATDEETWLNLRREPITHESSITSALFGSRPDENPLSKLTHWSERMTWHAGRRLNKAVVWFLERDSDTQRRKEDTAEARLERLHRYVKELGESLSSVRRVADRVACNRAQEMRGVSNMQAAIHALGTREGGKFGVMLQGVALEVPEENESTEEPKPNSVARALPPARALDEVLAEYEERAQGAQRIMNARKEEQDAYEHALETYTTLRNKLEGRTGSMWEENAEQSSEGFEELVDNVNVASARLAEVRKRYQAVAVSTTDELRRLRANMHEHISEALRLLATDYAKQHAAHASAWSLLAEQLGEYHGAPERQK